MSLVLLFHYLLLNMFRMLVHPSSGACNLLWIFLCVVLLWFDVCSQTVWHIPLLCVQRKTPDDGQKNYLKNVEFYSKNKFAKLVHLVGFIIRIIISVLFFSIDRGSLNLGILSLQLMLGFVSYLTMKFVHLFVRFQSHFLWCDWKHGGFVRVDPLY